MSMPIAVYGRGRIGKQIKPFDAVIYVQETTGAQARLTIVFFFQMEPRWLLAERFAALLRSRCKQCLLGR